MAGRPEEYRYDMLVSAASRGEAIAIASEALPAGKRATRVLATDVAEHEGKDSWAVTVYFPGPFGRGLED